MAARLWYSAGRGSTIVGPRYFRLLRAVSGGW